MITYPFSSPIILTDDIFIAYGGQTGTAPAAQRNAAYFIAEKHVTNYVGTFLLPTTVTGTYSYNGSNFVVTDYGYVHSVKSVVCQSIDSLTSCTLSDKDGCAFIFNDTFGYLNVSCANNQCGCAGWGQPYKYQIAYEAGLPTGTASQADILLALTVVAQETLNEMIYPHANESDGARGVEKWSSLDYSETRKKLKRTALGQSARANFAAELLDNSIKKARPYIGL